MRPTNILTLYKGLTKDVLNHTVPVQWQPSDPVLKPVGDGSNARKFKFDLSLDLDGPFFSR